MANHYCSNCGKPIPEGSRFCLHCKAAVIQEPVTQDHRNKTKETYNMDYNGMTKTITGMVCKKCGGTNILTTPVAEMDKRGCLSTLLKIMLLFIPVIGWIALFSIIRGRKTKTRLVSVCQDCGYKWYSGNKGTGVLTTAALIVGLVMLIAVFVTMIWLIGIKGDSKQSKQQTSYQQHQPYSTEQSVPTTKIDQQTAYTPIPEPTNSEEDRQVSYAIEAANTYMARGEYSKAYQALSEANESYPWRYELDNALTDCEKRYADNAIRLAAEVFAVDYDYDAAIAELKYAQIDLPDNTAIINEITKYEAYRPIKLSSLASFYDENGEGLIFTQTQIVDNTGNTYSEWYRWSYSGSDNSSTCYRVNRQYERMCGTIFIDADNKNEDFIGSISIYGDNKLIAGPFDMGKGTTPVYFEISISSIVELTIAVDTKGTYLYSSQRPHFANVMLYPKIDQ